jgi:hypothetical protein
MCGEEEATLEGYQKEILPSLSGRDDVEPDYFG